MDDYRLVLVRESLQLNAVWDSEPGTVTENNSSGKSNHLTKVYIRAHFLPYGSNDHCLNYKSLLNFVTAHM